MPIIGTAAIQANADTQRGVLVDQGGFFIERVSWRGDRPKINKTGTPKEERKRLVTLAQNPKAEDIPSPYAKWDFGRQEWVAPTDAFVLVEEKTGRVIKRFKGFKERLPECPAGCMIVDNELPKARGYRPVYDKRKDAFTRNRRVALINPDGVIENIVLENPNDTTPDVDVPEGWSRFDDSEEWPVDSTGGPVGIGYVRKRNGWSKPAGVE